MTPEAAACQTLIGEKLASIRSIHYIAVSTTTPTTPGSLEIETKTGRFVHVTPTDSDTFRIARGPVPAPVDPTRSFVRRWRDLTATTPFAFDGRPIVVRAEPIPSRGRTRGCLLAFSNGRRLVYAFSHGEPVLSTG